MRACISRATVLAGLSLTIIGCTSELKTTGFLEDYSKLEKVKDGKLQYVSPELREYSKYQVAPIQIRMSREKQALTAKQRAEVVNYTRNALERALKEEGWRMAAEPGVGVARIRIAITDIQKSKWYLNLHPASKLTGAGAGGASVEAECVDSITGRQLAAVVRAGRGNQFELDTFNDLDDVKDVIDKWAVEIRKRLRELREQRSK